jgi:two-component sensor histidine kinase
MTNISGSLRSGGTDSQRTGFVGWLSEVLRLGDSRFRDLIQALPAALFTTDAAGRITFYNEAAAALWESRPELGDGEWCCGSWKQYWPNGKAITPDDCPIKLTLKGLQPGNAAEAITERPDGTRVSLVVYPTPLRDASGEIVGTVNMLLDISERRRAEEQQKLLLKESMHRIKNTLATVQAIAMQTLRRTPKKERDAFIARLHSLGNAHDLLTNENWDRASIHDVLDRVLVPFGKERFVIEGAETWLNASTSLQLTMASHELATNAVKYGALSKATGRVHISWERSEPSRLKFRWQERGGRLVSLPKHKGFGSLLIEQAFDGAHFEFARRGITCAFDINLY